LTPSASDGTDDKAYASEPAANWVENSGRHTSRTLYQFPAHSNSELLHLTQFTLPITVISKIKILS